MGRAHYSAPSSSFGVRITTPMKQRYESRRDLRSHRSYLDYDRPTYQDQTAYNWLSASHPSSNYRIRQNQYDFQWFETQPYKDYYKFYSDGHFGGNHYDYSQTQGSQSYYQGNGCDWQAPSYYDYGRSTSDNRPRYTISTNRGRAHHPYTDSRSQSRNQSSSSSQARFHLRAAHMDRERSPNASVQTSPSYVRSPRPATARPAPSPKPVEKPVDTALTLVQLWARKRDAAITKKEIKQRWAMDSNDGLSVTSLRVSLNDPLLTTPMAIPGKGLNCRHLQCFDVASYLQLNEQTPTFKCPICPSSAGKLPLNQLFIDGYFEEVIKACASKLEVNESNEVELHSDGGWTLVEQSLADTSRDSGIEDEIRIDDDLFIINEISTKSSAKSSRPGSRTECEP